MNNKSFALLFAMLLAIAAALALALYRDRPETIGTSYAAFEAQRNIWESKRPASYAVTIDKHCYCPLWLVRVKVSGTEVQDVQFLNEPRSDPSVFEDRRRYPRDIDTLFEIIDAAYASRAYKIELTFDKDYGFPLTALIDVDLQTVDDEKSFELSKFVPLVSRSSSVNP